jgi:hypothetical protein
VGSPWGRDIDGATTCAAVLERAGLEALSFSGPPSDERDRGPYRGFHVLDAITTACDDSYYGRDVEAVPARPVAGAVA